MRFRLENCLVLCGEDLEPWFCRAFEVDGGRIQAIDGRKESHPEACLPCPVVIPGMWNGHTHLGDAFIPDAATGLSLEEGFFRPDGLKYRRLKEISAEEHHLSFVDALKVLAACGGVGHFDFREQGLEGTRRLRKAAQEVGTDAVILGQMNEVPFSEKTLEEDKAYLPANVVTELEALLEVADGFSESTMNDLTSPSWEQVKAMCKAAGKFKAIHCLENAGYRDVSLQRTGKGDLERALSLLDPDIIVHLTVANAEERERMALSGKTGVLNPRANAALSLPLPPVYALMEEGVPLMLGTDNGLLNTPDLFPELDFTWKLARSQAGIPAQPHPREILKMVTTIPSALLGPERGSVIREGGPCRIAVIDFSSPRLCRCKHLFASIVSRVSPLDVVLTVSGERVLHHQPDRFAL